MIEALHEECDDEKANEKFVKYINMGYFVLENNNKIVCQAGVRIDFGHESVEML